MTQYQITLNADLLHQLFIGDSRDAGVAALSGDFPFNAAIHPLAGRNYNDIRAIVLPVNMVQLWINLFNKRKVPSYLLLIPASMRISN